MASRRLCQDYSVAGKRAGLDGDRGALWWQFHRVIRETRPRFVVGENVPGLLSSGKGLSFRTIVGSLVELGYCVGWRVLDLRYFGVPQRRRRVFIVASLGDGSCAEILFEPESLCGDIAKGGEEGEDATRSVARCLRGRSNASHREDSDTYVAWTQNNASKVNILGEASGTLKADPGAGRATYIAHTLRAEGFDASEDGTGRGTPVVAFTCKDHGSDAGDIAPTMRSMGHGESHANGGGQLAVAFGWNKSPSQTMQVSDVTDALQASPSSNPAVLSMGVRRLTPRECERLTGLDDNFTRWTFDGKEVADGPRYRMCGNAWAVPQSHYIAERMATVLKRERLAA